LGLVATVVAYEVVRFLRPASPAPSLLSDSLMVDMLREEVVKKGQEIGNLQAQLGELSWATTAMDSGQCFTLEGRRYWRVPKAGAELRTFPAVDGTTFQALLIGRSNSRQNP
jgi:hypothetical protein